MGFTYRADLTTDRDKVRFYVRDTVEDSGPLPSSGNFSDEELDGLITAEGSWERAVAASFEALAAAWAGYVDIAVGPRKEQLSQTAERFEALAKEWRQRHGTSATATGTRFVTRVDGYSDDVSADET